MRRPLTGLLVFAAVAVIGSLAATSSAAEHERLATPSWARPTWLFGPVWTALYVLIAISGRLFWKRHGATWELGPFAAFGRRHRTAAPLLVPHLARVGFATALNASTTGLN